MKKNFRFFDNRQKYLLFVTTTNEKNIIADNIHPYLKKIKPKYVLHAAGLSRPMNIHDKKISKSIDLNIIGTANVVKICEKYKIKLIYFSTNYKYFGKNIFNPLTGKVQVNILHAYYYKIETFYEI